MIKQRDIAGLLPHLAILFTVLFWGMSFVSNKFILNMGLPPMTMAFLRYIIASSVLFPIMKMREPRFVLRRNLLMPLAVSGLIGIALYFYFELNGIQRTSVGTASMIIATIPIFTLCVEFLFYKTRIPWYKGLGILLSVTGVYIIISQSGDNGTGSLAGNLFMLGACFCWVVYLMFTKGFKDKNITGLALTTYQCLFGGLFLLPLALLEHSQWGPIPFIAWINIFYLALLCTALSFFFYIYALTHLGTVTLSSYTNLIPMVGVLGGVLLMRETLHPTQLIGGGVIILGVFAVNYQKKQKYIALPSLDI